MSIKNAIRRIEGLLTKNTGSQLITFVIPYCKDVSYSEIIKSKLINQNGLVNRSEIQIIFVTDFAMTL